MDKMELVKWARNCANPDMSPSECAGCPYDGKGCNDAMLRDLATELENSISKADFKKALRAFQKNDRGDLTHEQSLIYETVFKASNNHKWRSEMLGKHKEYYMMYNGKLLSARELIKSYENDSGNIATNFFQVKAYYCDEILVEIPKENITYAMLLRHGKKVEAIRMYRETENVTLSDACDFIKFMESNI